MDKHGRRKHYITDIDKEVWRDTLKETTAPVFSYEFKQYNKQIRKYKKEQIAGGVLAGGF